MTDKTNSSPHDAAIMAAAVTGDAIVDVLREQQGATFDVVQVIASMGNAMAMLAIASGDADRFYADTIGYAKTVQPVLAAELAMETQQGAQSCLFSDAPASP